MMSILIMKKVDNSIYFKGNAFKKLGRFDDAIKMYDLVLEINPKHYYAC